MAKSLNSEQLTSLLSVARRHSELDYRALLIGFNHGLRVTELVGGWLTDKEGKRSWYPGLTKANVIDGHLVVQRLKGSHRTIQALLPSERDAVLHLAATCVGRFFPISRKTLWLHAKQYAEEAGVPTFLATPHRICKHTCAMLGLKGGMGLNELQTYLGHVSGSSTMMYLRVNDEAASSAFAKAFAGV
jgi:integrase